MKSIITNKFFIFIIIVTVAMSAFLLLNNKKLSPQETVELYFTYFNNKDVKGKQSLVADSLKSVDGTEYLEYVHLLSCYEELNEEKTDYEQVKKFWSPEAQYVAKVHATFDIKYVDNAPSTSGFENGVHYWIFHLAKESENDPWIIVSYGN